MSMLARFKRPGGFASLVLLVESCDGKKRQNLLNSIHREDPVWAQLVYSKVLDFRTVFSWQSPIVMEIISIMRADHLGTVLHGVSEEHRIRALKEAMPKNLSDAAADFYSTSNPSEEQILTVGSAIVARTRQLTETKVLRLGDFAPQYQLLDPTPDDLAAFAAA